MNRSLRKLHSQMIESIHHGNVTAVINLLNAGVPVDEATSDGTTPLYLASVQGQTEIVSVLLERGADPNVESRGESEGTPLCAAASWGHTDIVKELLDHGADPNQVESPDFHGGMTALEWARHAGREETARVLVERGAVDRRPPSAS